MARSRTTFGKICCPVCGRKFSEHPDEFCKVRPVISLQRVTAEIEMEEKSRFYRPGAFKPLYISAKRAEQRRKHKSTKDRHKAPNRTGKPPTYTLGPAGFAKLLIKPGHETHKKTKENRHGQKSAVFNGPLIRQARKLVLGRPA